MGKQSSQRVSEGKIVLAGTLHVHLENGELVLPFYLREQTAVLRYKI
jgi:hypothetical protein